MLSTVTQALTRRPRRTLLIAALFVLIAGALGGPVAGSLRSSGGFVPAHSDSQLAIGQIEAATGRQISPGIVLVLRTPRGARDARSAIRATAARLAAVDGIAATQAPAAVARDGRSVLVTATLAAGASDTKVAGRVRAAFAQRADVTVGGSSVASHEITSTVSQDLGRAELFALPLLIALSLLFFRGRAALAPLAAGVTTVLGTFLAMSAINHVYGLSVFALNLVIGLGLGLSIDYTLFLVTRFREELAAGRAVGEAISVTMANAGRTVLFSAATVAAALATLITFPQGFLRSMGIAGATVAVVAALSALALTPALLALWGDRLGDRRDGAPPARRWYRFARAVMRRPGPIAAITAAVMVLAALPALGTVWSPVDSSVVPRGQSARTVSDLITRGFDGAGRSPVTVAISAPPARAASVGAYAVRLRAIPGVTGVRAPRSLGRDTWQIDLAVSGDAAGAGAQRVVARVRSAPAPFRVHVAGDAAAFVDQQATIASHLPLAIGLLAGLTFLVLWLMTDSIVLPTKALVMNALTVGTALAPLVLIYQHGRLTGLLGYTSNGGVEPSDFLVTATLVFALSTDYGVFLLGRIKEARDAGADEREAVAQGLGATGRVITAAAILLAVAIGAFSTSSISFIQQIGVATATGVLVDAFVVRSLLVPSLMALLGRFNWFAPRPLRHLRAALGRLGGTPRRAITSMSP